MTEYSRTYRILFFLFRNELPFHLVTHLKNAWNDNINVKVSRDGQEIDPACGETLCRLFPPDLTADLEPASSAIQRQLEERARQGKLGAAALESGQLDPSAVPRIMLPIDEVMRFSAPPPEALRREISSVSSYEQYEMGAGDRDRDWKRDRRPGVPPHPSSEQQMERLGGEERGKEPEQKQRSHERERERERPPPRERERSPPSRRYPDRRSPPHDRYRGGRNERVPMDPRGMPPPSMHPYEQGPHPPPLATFPPNLMSIPMQSAASFFVDAAGQAIPLDQFNRPIPHSVLNQMFPPVQLQQSGFMTSISPLHAGAISAAGGGSHMIYVDPKRLAELNQVRDGSVNGTGGGDRDRLRDRERDSDRDRNRQRSRSRNHSRSRSRSRGRRHGGSNNGRRSISPHRSSRRSHSRSHSRSHHRSGRGDRRSSRSKSPPPSRSPRDRFTLEHEYSSSNSDSTPTLTSRTF